MGELIAICALIMFSVNVIMTKIASGRLDLNTGFLISISVNVLFSGLVLVAWLLVSGHTIEFHSWGFLMFVLSGFLSSYMGRYLYFDSIAKLGPAKASTFMISNPLFTVIFSWLLLREQLHALELAAMLLVLLGLFVAGYVPSNKSKPSAGATTAEGNYGHSQPGPQKQATLLPNKQEPVHLRIRSSWNTLLQPGVLLALMGSISYALGNITRGSAIQDWNEPVLGGFLGALTGLVLQLLLNKSSRTFLTSLRAADRKGVWLYAISGVLTISAQIGHISAMHYIPISIATLITNSQPLLVIPLSYYLLKNQEGINLRTVLGSLLVLAGIGIITLY